MQNASSVIKKANYSRIHLFMLEISAVRLSSDERLPCQPQGKVSFTISKKKSTSKGRYNYGILICRGGLAVVLPILPVKMPCLCVSFWNSNVEPAI